MTLDNNVWAFLCAIFLGAYFLWPPWTRKETLPLVNGKRFFEISGYRSKLRFLADAKGLIEKGFKQSPSGFRVLSNTGERVVLPSGFAEELRTDDRLSSLQYAREEFLAHIPVFGPLAGISTNGKIFIRTIKKITGALDLLTEPLSEEVGRCLQTHWSDRPDWHEIRLLDVITSMIVQVSSRAFVGPDLCNDPRWISAAVGYTSLARKTASTFHLFPKFLHPFLARFWPVLRETQAHLDTARTLLDPLLEERERERGGKEPRNDAVTWMQDVAGDTDTTYDKTELLLSLAFVATNMAPNYLTKLLVDLCQNPELIPALRQEIITVIGTGGVTKTSIMELHLMDSVMKESQRARPIALATMTRQVTETFTTSTGLQLTKGENLLISTDAPMDPSLYPNPDRFDGYRFVKMCAASGQGNSHRFVSTSANHLGFGYGRHACPGRFFASHMIKLLLCHILLKYDIKLVGGDGGAREVGSGFFVIKHPEMRVLTRRRVAEISL